MDYLVKNFPRSRYSSLAAGALPFIACALAAPYLNNYAISVLTLVFLFAFFGQAWNLILGFAGQLSLGQALFAGLGGYTAVILLSRYGVSPWLGIPAGVCAATTSGAIIAWLAFRFSVRGVHFALLTIAFAECTRVCFANWDFAGGTAGLFLPALGEDNQPLLTLRGGPLFAYAITLGLAAAGTIFTAWLRASWLGYVWRAMRDDEAAARALGIRTFGHKIAATAISAGMTGLGGAFYALINGSLFPDSMMGLMLSIEIITGPIIGGLGTVFGPLVGALFTVLLGQATGSFGQATGVFGLNMLAFGISLVLVVGFLPGGLWPATVALASRWRTSRRVPAMGPVE